MKTTQPIYHLKRKAKALSRAEDIPLHQALDRIARDEGYGRWSLLAAKASETTPASELFAHLRPGDLLLVGARPGRQRQVLRRQRFADHGIHRAQGGRVAGYAVNHAQRRPGQL
ncbi:DNA helicase, partial [Rhizobium phaseoli]